MIFDFGDESGFHLAMMLDEQLIRYGFDCEITHAIDYEDNEYGEIGDAEKVYPDELEPAQPNNAVVTTCLLSKPIQGLMLNPDFISYVDKVEMQYQVTLKEGLRLDDRIKITMPDGKWLTLKIVEVNGYHPGTSVWFSGMGMVTREPFEESKKQRQALGLEPPDPSSVYGDLS